MTGQLAIVAVVSLGAAACYAVASVLEQRRAAAAPPEMALRFALLWHLAKQPVWWLAIAVDVGGFGLQTLALGLGRIVFVQPLLLTSLPIALVLGQRLGSHRLTRTDLWWAVLFVASLSVFLIVGDPAGGVSTRAVSIWVVPLVAVAVVTAVLVGFGRTGGSVRRSLLLGLAAGMLFGVSSTMMKPFAHHLAHDGVGALAHWEPWVLAVAVTGGFLIMQSAFQAGDLRTSLPAVDLAEPVVASLFGIIVLEEHLQASGVVPVAVLVVAVGVMILSVIRLAESAATDRIEVDTTA